MSDTITWIRPSGREITTNGLPATIEQAAKLGWVPKGAEVAKAPDPAPKPPARTQRKARD